MLFAAPATGTLDRLLEVGAGRVVTGSAAIEQPELLIRWLEDYGPERVVLALDVKCDESAPQPTVMTRGWTVDSGLGLWTELDRYAQAGVRHVLCTDIGRDGAMTGPAARLYGECVRRYPDRLPGLRRRPHDQ